MARLLPPAARFFNLIRLKEEKAVSPAEKKAEKARRTPREMIIPMLFESILPIIVFFFKKWYNWENFL
jgi:hypothetical protein